jgi:hypothetical protein
MTEALGRGVGYLSGVPGGVDADAAVSSRTDRAVDAYIKDLEAQPSQTVGEVFVFVDECHRTRSGKLHRVMNAKHPASTLSAKATTCGAGATC